MGYILVIVAMLALAIPFAVAWHLRRATARLVVADRAWGSLEQHAHALFDDRNLHPLVGDLVERVLLKIGDGSLTRKFLYFIVFRPNKNENPDSEWITAIQGLEAGQEKQLSHFMIDAIFYDSLRTAISGGILRRVVLYWLESTARDETAPVSRQQIKPITFAANRTFKAVAT